ncbi:MAG: TIGR01777 family oxidoreductase, partial [Deltaproteobacteria bacterium]|nr:TIGR01777 family oxidoreductase [Deltaproteobacteria bacterium]
MRVAISGATGLIGTQLCAFLSTGGHRVDRLVRRPSGGTADASGIDIRWDPAGGEVDVAALDGVDAVVHLAGENVGQRWTKAAKNAVLSSRVDGTRTLATALARLARPPRVFVSASAVGFYGDTGDAEVDETSPGGDGFLTDVCRAWEGAAEPARAAGIPVVHPRIGVVLSGAGGALGQMRTPFSLGVGGPVGSGRQWMSWIAMDDAVGALHHLLYAGLEGPVNLVAPAPVRQADFARALGRTLGRPAVMPLPALAVRVLFGEMGQGVLLAGQRVLPTRLAASGFS